MATPTIPGTEEHISTQSIFILVGALIVVHVAAFGFWIWRLVTEDKRAQNIKTD